MDTQQCPQCWRKVKGKSYVIMTLDFKKNSNYLGVAAQACNPGTREPGRARRRSPNLRPAWFTCSRTARPLPRGIALKEPKSAKQQKPN